MLGRLDRDFRVARPRLALFAASVTLLFGGLHNIRDGIRFEGRS